MHIIALASYLSTQRGGLERSLFDVCQQLAQRGHDITLLYEEPGDQLALFEKFCKRIIRVSSYRLKLNFLKDILAIPTDANTVIYSNQYNNFFFGSTLATIKKNPFVCHLRLHASTESGHFKKIKQSLTLSKIDRYIAISEAVKIDWSTQLKISPEKIDIVYNGIDFQNFQSSEDLYSIKSKWGLAPQEKVISYVGRLETDKGIETLIRAFALLKKTGVPAKLLIAGKPLFSGEDYPTSLAKLAEHVGIANDVKFLGHLSDTRPIYQLSDVNVLPSLWLEAFGRVIIESMACGTPSLGSQVGGIPEVLTGEFSDWLFTPGDEHDLYIKLKTILYWRDTDPGLVQRCRQHVIDNFSLHQTIDGIEAVLQKALNR